MNDLLKYELNRNLLGHLSLYPKDYIGRLPPTEKVYKTDKSFSIQEDNGSRNVSVYAGACKIDTHELECNYLYSGDEVAVVLAINTRIIGVLFSYEDDFSEFLTYKEKWEGLNSYEILSFAAGFEKLSDVGIFWKPVEKANFIKPLDALISY